MSAWFLLQSCYWLLYFCINWFLVLELIKDDEDDAKKMLKFSVQPLKSSVTLAISQYFLSGRWWVRGYACQQDLGRDSWIWNTCFGSSRPKESEICRTLMTSKSDCFVLLTDRTFSVFFFSLLKLLDLFWVFFLFMLLLLVWLPACSIFILSSMSTCTHALS